jgi:hypothetical protein
MTDDVTTVKWADFRTYWQQNWEQGQHVTCIGPTGRGKTTLLVELFDMAPWGATLATKIRDDTMTDAIKQRGWVRTPIWPVDGEMKWRDRLRSVDIPKGTHYVYWPKPDDTLQGSLTNQKRHCVNFLNGCYKQGAWGIFIDELYYVNKTLGLEPITSMLYTQARSAGISIFAGSQRPRWVGLQALTQATHLLLFPSRMADDLARMGEMNGQDADRIVALLEGIPYDTYQFLYVNLWNGEMMISKVDK